MYQQATNDAMTTCKNLWRKYEKFSHYENVIAWHKLEVEGRYKH